MNQAESAPADSRTRERFQQLRTRLNRGVLGQPGFCDRLLIALLADGHLLVEGVPGLAKTEAVKALANGVEGEFQRIQFTPDLLPGDLIGTEIYRPEEGSFRFEPGPLFHSLLLADEINRAPAKVQSALLEAMAERQVTVGRTTYPLPGLFLVMATQNPLDHHGTYPLPEAQQDRFLMKLQLRYPAAEMEPAILQLGRERARAQLLRHETAAAPEPPLIDAETLRAARLAVLDLHLAAPLEEYLVELILATRSPGHYGPELERWIGCGASPRATLALERCARAHAWLAGRDYVSPADIQALAADVLRHRIHPSFEAQTEGVDAERILAELVARVPVP